MTMEVFELLLKCVRKSHTAMLSEASNSPVQLSLEELQEIKKQKLEILLKEHDIQVS